jgi:hypothetical protein
MTLPPTYKYFISAWESTSSDQRTLANLISRLTAEESRMSTENPENVAFASTKVNFNKPGLKGTCNYCKKTRALDSRLQEKESSQQEESSSTS